MTADPDTRARPDTTVSNPVDIAAAFDRRGADALCAGDRNAAAGYFRNAAMAAAQSGDKNLFLRQLVRWTVVERLEGNVAAIRAQAGPSRDLAGLFEQYGSDLLGIGHQGRVEPPDRPVAGGSGSVGVARRGATVVPGRVVVGLGAAGLAAIVGWSMVGPIGRAVGGSGLGTTWEVILGWLLASLHLAEAVFYDPLGHTVPVLWRQFDGVQIPAGLAWAGLAGAGSWHALSILLLACLVAGVVRVTLVHKGAAKPQASDTLIFARRRLWYAYHRRLLLLPMMVLASHGARAVGVEWLSFVSDAIASGCILALLWLAVPASRPLLLIVERPGEPRQSRLEELSGIWRVRHDAPAIYDLRTATLAPSPWWSWTQDIDLKRLDGTVMRLNGYTGPADGRRLTGEINRLIRNVPPLQLPRDEHHRHV